MREKSGNVFQLISRGFIDKKNKAEIMIQLREAERINMSSTNCHSRTHEVVRKAKMFPRERNG